MVLLRICGNMTGGSLLLLTLRTYDMKGVTLCYPSQNHCTVAYKQNKLTKTIILVCNNRWKENLQCLTFNY